MERLLNIQYVEIQKWYVAVLVSKMIAELLKMTDLGNFLMTPSFTDDTL